MATVMRTKVAKNVGTIPVDVLSPGERVRYTIIGCNLANTVNDDVIVDITVVDATAVEGFYIKQLVIAPYTSAKVVTNGEKINIAENCKLKIVSDTDNGLDVVISYAEIS